MFKIVGIKNIDYINKNDKHIQGCELHTIYEDGKVEGYATENFYISQSILDESGIEDVKVDDMIECFYNKFGRISRVSIIGNN